MTTDSHAFRMVLITPRWRGGIKLGSGLEKETKLKSGADVLPKWRGRVVVSSACVLREHMKAAPVNPRRRAHPPEDTFSLFCSSDE